MTFSKKHITYLSNKSRTSQVPVLKAGEMLVMAEKNFMLDSDIVPFLNFNRKEDWVVNIEKNTPGSYRTCPGGTDLMQLGLTIPLWGDIHIRPSMDKKMIEAEFNIERENDGQHAGMIDNFMQEQTGKCPYTDRRKSTIEKTQYLKLVNPFMFKTPKGYSTLITGSQLNPRKEFDVISGVVNTDYYHTCNVVLNVLVDDYFMIERGTPIAQMFVFKRSENIKHLYIGDETVHGLHKRLGFGGPLKLGRWKRGKYKKEQRLWDSQQ